MFKYNDWDNILKNSFTPQTIDFINSIKDDDVVYDVGGNIGSFSDLVLNKRPNIRVFIFEPIKDYYESIVERFKNKNNVKIFNCALIESDRNLSISKDGSNLGWNTISEIQHYGNQELIPGRSLSSLVEEESIPLPTMIKVDIELSEHLFIEGCKDLFSKHIPNKILMEIGITPAHYLWEKEKNMIEYLFDIGYKKFDYQNMKHTYDALFEK